MTPMNPIQRSFGPRTLAGLTLAAALLVASAASASTGSIVGTHPRDGGQLVGNVVMFIGWDLVVAGKVPKAKVIATKTKAAVPHTVKGRCKPASRPGAPKQCFIEVRLKRWKIGTWYSATVLGKTVRFTIQAGDPGKHPKGRG